MKNDFKYLTAFAAAFVALFFSIGTIMNLSKGRYQMAVPIGVVTLFFIALSVVFYLRANKRGRKQEAEENRLMEKEMEASTIKLPAKHNITPQMKPEAIAIVKLIHVAIDQALERDYVATRIVLKQVEDKLVIHPSSLDRTAWERDITQIHDYIAEQEEKIIS